MNPAVALRLLDLAIVGLTYWMNRTEVQDRTLERLEAARRTAVVEGFAAIPDEYWISILDEAHAAAQDTVNRLKAAEIPADAPADEGEAA